MAGARCEKAPVHSGGGDIRTKHLSGDPAPAGVEPRARLAGGLALCIARNADSSEICTKSKFEPTIWYAGFRWDFDAVSQHVGRSVSTGHYVTISRADNGDCIRIDDGMARRIGSHAAAWGSIDREPIALFYNKRPAADVNYSRWRPAASMDGASLGRDAPVV